MRLSIVAAAALAMALSAAAFSTGPGFAQAPSAPANSVAAPTNPANPSVTVPAASPEGALAPRAIEPLIQTDGRKTKALDLLPHDLSPWAMFMAADILVKIVMTGLAFASLVTWTILFAKTIEFGTAKRSLRAGLARLETARGFAEARLAIGRKDRLLSDLLGAALSEVKLSDGALRDAGIKERADSRIAELVRAEGQSMRRGMPILATIGSTAPFVGLFGTVWGIMNAFIGISKAQTTNLAVVAPGIAEALLATAIGLVAAIPAVVIYNHFSQQGRRHQAMIAQAAGVVQRLLSRELDRGLGGLSIQAAE